MAQFRAIIHTQRGSTSRLGHKSSGLDVELNGWNCGVKVSASFNEQTQKDEFTITQTGGSHAASLPKTIKTIKG